MSVHPGRGDMLQTFAAKEHISFNASRSRRVPLVVTECLLALKDVDGIIAGAVVIPSNDSSANDEFLLLRAVGSIGEERNRPPEGVKSLSRRSRLRGSRKRRSRRRQCLRASLRSFADGKWSAMRHAARGASVMP